MPRPGGPGGHPVPTPLRDIHAPHCSKGVEDTVASRKSVRKCSQINQAPAKMGGKTLVFEADLLDAARRMAHSLQLLCPETIPNFAPRIASSLWRWVATPHTDCREYCREGLRENAVDLRLYSATWAFTTCVCTKKAYLPALHHKKRISSMQKDVRHNSLGRLDVGMHPCRTHTSTRHRYQLGEIKAADVRDAWRRYRAPGARPSD